MLERHQGWNVTEHTELLRELTTRMDDIRSDLLNHASRWSEANATRIAAALNAAEDDGCSEEFWSWLFDNCEVTWQPKTVGNGTVISSQCVNDKSEQQQIRNKWAT